MRNQKFLAQSIHRRRARECALRIAHKSSKVRGRLHAAALALSLYESRLIGRWVFTYDNLSLKYFEFSEHAIICFDAKIIRGTSYQL